MHVKSQLRKFLGEALHKTEVINYRDRIVNKQAIKNIVRQSDDQYSGSVDGLLRVLATDEANAKLIAGTILAAKQDLPIKSIQIADRAIDYRAPIKQKPAFSHSVVVQLDSKELLKSAIQAHNKNLLLKELLNEEALPETIVIDFSSPNIAKPFHFGHLKSTILGNYLANLNTYLGNNVVKLNYIGDWGTQYGLLSLGLDEFSSNKEGPHTLRSLLEIYAKANDRGNSDEAFYCEARRRFMEMDLESNSKEREQWLNIKTLSMNELKNSYDRLGISFDHFDFESNHAKGATNLVESMKAKGFVKKLEDGVRVVEVEKNRRSLTLPVLKSDGASLYITRDVAAAIKRKEKFDFDKMLYVVGADQEKHFHCLKEIISKLGYSWFSQLIHIKMGKVLGMSSRQGNVVLLSDIIDEATKRYIASTRSSPTKKVNHDCDIEDVGRNLALSALFVFDMRNARNRHYEFNWEPVMQNSSRSGINLQTTFARISSLLDKSSAAGIEPVDSSQDLSSDAISCVEGINLLSHLDELDNELFSSYWAHDPSPLVNYSLSLCKAINRARQSDRLRVLDEPDERKARTRLSLFKSCHAQLELIIKLIGLKPLYKV